MLLASAIPLAANDFGDDLGDGVAGPVGLLIVVLLAIATALLVRNMNKRLKRLPQSFPDPDSFDSAAKARTPKTRVRSLDDADVTIDPVHRE